MDHLFRFGVLLQMIFTPADGRSNANRPWWEWFRPHARPAVCKRRSL